MKVPYVIVMVVMVLCLGISGLINQFTMQFPTPPDTISANENLAFSLFCLALGVWGLLALAIDELKERL